MLKLVRQLVTALLVARGGCQTSYMYKFEYDLHLATPKSYAVSPIVGLPGTHPLVTNTICGVTRSAGDPIPASGKWSETGASGANDASCKTKTGGELFYAYKCAPHPHPHHARTRGAKA